jgi:hypothetical protein
VTEQVFRDPITPTGTKPVFNESTSSPVIPDEVIQQRAQKYDTAMGEHSPGVEQLATNIQVGTDWTDRQRLAAEKGRAMRTEQLKLLDQFVQAKGTPTTQEDIDFAMSLTEAQVQNPETIFETEYAKKVLSASLYAEENPTLDESLEEDFEGTNQDIDKTSHAVAFKEGIQRILEGLEAQQKDQSWAGWMYDYGRTWLPFASHNEVLEVVPGAETTREGGPFSLLMGEEKKRQYDYLRFLPLDEGLKQAQAVANEMSASNLEDAIMFFRGMQDYSGTSKAIDDMISGMDLTIVGGMAAKIGKGVVRAKSVLGAAKDSKKAVEAAKAELAKTDPNSPLLAADDTYDAAKATPAERTQRSLVDRVKGLLKRNTDPEEILASSGFTDEASLVGSIKRLKDIIAGGVRDIDKPASMHSITTALPSIFNPESWMALSSKVFSGEAQRRIVNTVLTSTPDLLKALSGGLRIDRLGDTDQMLAAMAVQARDNVRLQYPEIVDTIVDTVPSYSGITNTWRVGVRFGDENAQLFKTANAAMRTAERRGYTGSRISPDNVGKYRVGQQGSGYYIEVFKNVDETDPKIRSLLLDTHGETPRTLATTFFGYLRSPEDKLSAIANQDRKVAVFGTGEIQMLMQKSAERIGTLPKKSRRDLFTFIENDRVHETTYTIGNKNPEVQVGRFATTQAEFESRWVDTFGRAPSEAESVAYLEYVRLNDLDWAFRNFRLYRDKARKGVEIFDMVHTSVNGLGQKSKMDFKGIEGRTVQDLPWETPEDTGILILRNNEMRYLHKNDPDAKSVVQDLLTKNHRMVQVTPFGDSALRANTAIKEMTGEDTIRFVVTDKFEVSPLPIKQLNNMPGGHIANQDGWYVAQPKITRVNDSNGNLRESRYDTDTNINLFSSQAQARKFSKAYDDVRIMLKEGRSEKEIDVYIGKHLDKDPSAVKALFKPKMDKDGKVVGRAALSLDDPIDVRATGERLGNKMNLSATNPRFRDSSNDPFNMYSGFNLEYTGKRGELIHTVDEVGDENNPLFKTRPAMLVDAMTTLNRSLQTITKSRFLDDIKTKETEKFAQEFGHLLDVTPEDLALDPMKHVYNPRWKQGLAGPDFSAAQNSLMALKQLLGAETQFSKNIRYVKQKVLDSVYTRFGQKRVEQIEPYLLYTTKDPVKYARGLAFHTKLGMFNPTQLFLQAQTFVHMAAIAGPTTAMRAGPSALLMRSLRFTDDPGIINKFAQYAKAYGVSPEEFKEAYSLMRETGMDRVGGEVAFRDDVFDVQLIQTAAGKFGHWSTSFFTEGERFARVSAYNAAYMEWRAANKMAKVTDKVKRELLQRADLLSGNMTRASNAAWQQGFASVPTQFFAYQARIAEQLLGKRLTTAEKMKVLGAYSLIYGIPVAGGATTMVWPWHETLRKELIERGIDYDDNVISRTMMDGIVSSMVQFASGTKYNVGERYGPGGLSTFRDWATGEKDGAELLVGVSGSVIYDMFRAIDPVITDVADIFSGNQDAYPLMIEDMIDFTKEISSVNSALKMVYGINFGKYITKNEIYMTDLTTDQSIFMGLAGLTPQEVPNAFLKGEILKDMDEAQKDASKEAIKWIRRGLKANDSEDRIRYFTRAKKYVEGSGMDIRMQSETISQALKGYTSFVESIDMRFAKSSPERMDELIKAQTENMKNAPVQSPATR